METTLFPSKPAPEERRGPDKVTTLEEGPEIHANILYQAILHKTAAELKVRQRGAGQKRAPVQEERVKKR